MVVWRREFYIYDLYKRVKEWEDGFKIPVPSQFTKLATVAAELKAYPDNTVPQSK
jgi:hypothetical protein